MIDEREKAQLERHIQEAEGRAAAGGHVLGPWRPAPPDGLFNLEAICTRCGEKVQVGYAALFVTFARKYPGTRVKWLEVSIEQKETGTG